MSILLYLEMKEPQVGEWRVSWGGKVTTVEATEASSSGVAENPHLRGIPPRKRTGWSLFLGLLIPLHSQATTWVEKVVLTPENALKQQAACAGSLTWLSEGS